jgi:hypothetical protein
MPRYIEKNEKIILLFLKLIKNVLLKKFAPPPARRLGGASSTPVIHYRRCCELLHLPEEWLGDAREWCARTQVSDQEFHGGGLRVVGGHVGGRTACNN